MSDRFELAKMAVAQLSRRERVELDRLFFDTDPKPAAPPEDRICRRLETARLLGRSRRAVDRLAAEGGLRRVTLPGRKRAAGYRLADVLALVGGRA